ncbi:MAG: glycerate kinase [Acidimicrobiales bacterium]|nr:glycerate kinase [Acidimicrobiales bacterium]
MRVVVAPDKFRGTADARAVGEALARGLRAGGARVDVVPMADGGEGTLDALGGANRSSVVTGPLGDAVTAPWRLDGRRAVIEMAKASGLALVGGAECNDPVGASTVGTGELITEAVDAGARRVVVGVGGSATTDGGFGALRAMYPLQRFRGVELVVACDVRTRFVDAAPVFAPQKGASAAQVELLRRRLERLAQMYRAEYGIDVLELPRSGAAGGLAGGLAAVGARLVDGFDLVADELDLDERIAEADLVVTGEGFLDEESFEGKVVGGVAGLAAANGVPCIAVVGQVLDGLNLDGLTPELPVVSLTDEFGRERSFGDTVACLEEVAPRLLAHAGA